MWLKSFRLEADLYRTEPKLEPQRREQALPAPSTASARTEPSVHTSPSGRNREYTLNGLGLTDIGSLPAYSDGRTTLARRENNSSAATKPIGQNYQTDFPPLSPANGRGSASTPTPTWPSTTPSYGASTTRLRRVQPNSSSTSDDRRSLFLGGPEAAELGYDFLARIPPRTSLEADWSGPAEIPSFFADDSETTDRSKSDSL